MPGQLVGRRQQMETIQDLLQGRRNEKLVRVSGVPGVGKSRLLREIGLAAKVAGWTSSNVDLESLELGRAGLSLPELLASTVLRLLTAGLTSGDRQAAKASFDSAMKRAGRELAADRPAVKVIQTATLGGHIENISIDVVDARVAEQAALIRYRESVVVALSTALDGFDLSKAIVGFDSCEILTRLSASNDSNSTNLARWFELDLLGQILDLRQPPTIVLAASEPYGVATPASAVDFKLVPWTEAESLAYGLDLGLAPEAADALARACDGLPLWANLLGEAALNADNERQVDEDWLQQIATNGPAEEWVPKALLSRIPSSDQDVIAAAAALRSITFESVAAAVPSCSQDDWVRLTEYSFVRITQDLDGTSARRLHGLLSRAIRAYLRADRPLYLRALHLRAAEYYDQIGHVVEADYHRFSAGESSHVGAWLESCATMIDEYDFEKLFVHLGAADAVIEGLAVGGDSPHIRGLVYEWRAKVAEMRDQIDTAIELAQSAVDQYRGTDAYGDHCDALDLLAGLHFRTGRVEEGLAFFKRSLHFARQAGDDNRTGRALKRLATRASDEFEKQRFLQEALESFRQGNDRHRIASTLRALGDLDPDPARRRQLYEEAAAVFSADDACLGGKGESEEALALLEFNESDHSGVRARLVRAEELFRKAGSGSGRGRVLRALAHVALLEQDFDQASGYFDEALVAFEAARDMVELADTYQALAEATADWRGVRSAQRLLVKAHETHREIGDVHGVSRVMEATGKLQARQKAWPRERDALDGALNGYRIAKDARAQIRVLRALAASAGEFPAIAELMITDVSDLRKYEAMTYLREAHRLALGVAPEKMADLAFLMGQLHLHQRKFEAARQRFAEAEARLDSFTEIRNRAVVRRQIAAVDFAEGEPAEAALTCSRAIGALTPERHADILAYLHQDLGDYLSVCGETARAEENYQLAREFFDSAY